MIQIGHETARVPLIETRRLADHERAKDRAERNAKRVERGKGGGTLDGGPAAQIHQSFLP
ncbi:hypothetical protein [Methylocystis echinoides]|uniref:Uncharacterized protein n=1 Tax=Methylocystis echinoides TaxID=29468 RepID=A0A9W6LTM1_9HYPH|nr:hypothetical protein [Methylocystis echinoides]GLI94672.1 hypothetical protein LMG27198_36640 [Methylocystis echinoides]